MSRARGAVGLVAVVAAGALLVSGGSRADPQTPQGLPGLPPPFLGTAVVGSGGLTAALGSYGDVVALRGSGPAGGDRLLWGRGRPAGLGAGGTGADRQCARAASGGNGPRCNGDRAVGAD